MEKIRNIFRGNEGFTLIELLIVIVILGVLAAIAIPNLTGLTESANEEVVKANLRTLATEIEARRASGEDFDPNKYNAWTELKGMDDVTATVPTDASYSDYEFKVELKGVDYDYKLSSADGIITAATDEPESDG